MVRVFTQVMCLHSQTIPSPQPRPQEISIYNRQCNQPWEKERHLKSAVVFTACISRLATVPLLSGSQVHLPTGSQIFLWTSFSLLSLHQYCNWVNACIVGRTWASCIFWSFGNVYCRAPTELLAWSLGLSSQHWKVSQATVLTLEWSVNVHRIQLQLHMMKIMSTCFLIKAKFMAMNMEFIAMSMEFIAMNSLETHTYFPHNTQHYK